METEKRKFKRFDAYMSVKYSGTEGTTSKGIGISRDLCREGLKINFGQSLKEGSQLHLEILNPDDPKPIFSAGESGSSRTANASSKDSSISR